MLCGQSMCRLDLNLLKHPSILEMRRCPCVKGAPCRRHNAERKVILWSGVAYAVMAAWSLFTQTTAGTQPLIAATVIGGASNVWKLQQIFPPGPSGSGNASGKPRSSS